MSTAIEAATLIGKLDNHGNDWGEVYMGRFGNIFSGSAGEPDADSQGGLIGYAPEVNAAAARYRAALWWLEDPDVDFIPNGPTFDRGQLLNPRQKVCTVEEWRRMIANAKRSREAAEASDGGREPDHKPVVHLFGGPCDWLLTEIIEPDEGIAFGLADLGMGCPELGYIDLREICARFDRLPLIERDLCFKPRMTLSEYADDARLNSRVRP